VSASSSVVFPGESWEVCDPGDVGCDEGALSRVRAWHDEAAGDARYRIAIVRDGRLIAQWCRGLEPEDRSRCASAAKSVYSTMLGIAVDEGVIPSSDARAVEYYPQMMDVPDGSGPKPGRHAFEKDRTITLRQLITNTSGYMKPGEEPGKVHHYQTYGMNILCHAIREAYGAPSFGELVEAKLRDPIGGTWGWEYTNFRLPERARIDIFGNYTQLSATAGDLARWGWLWLNRGEWDGARVVSAAYLDEATRSIEDVEWKEERARLCYGAGFWTNSHDRLWPGLPTDAYAAYGAGRIAVNVFPSQRLVVAQAPGIFENHPADGEGLLKRVLECFRSRRRMT